MLILVTLDMYVKSVGANGLANPRDFETPTGNKDFSKKTALSSRLSFQRGTKIARLILQLFKNIKEVYSNQNK